LLQIYVFVLPVDGSQLASIVVVSGSSLVLFAPYEDFFLDFWNF